MNNRITKGIEDYLKKCEKWKGTEGALYPHDVFYAVESAEVKTPAEIAQNALMAGFMIGYRKGIKDAKKGAAK